MEDFGAPDGRGMMDPQTEIQMLQASVHKLLALQQLTPTAPSASPPASPAGAAKPEQSAEGGHESAGAPHEDDEPTQMAEAIRLCQKYSLPLLLGVVLAMIMSNFAGEAYHEMFHSPILSKDLTIFGHEISLHFLINDIFMAFFFGIAAKEITEACLPGGSLNPPSKAANPLMATIGGVAGPVAVYFLLGMVFHGGGSFGAPSETDFCLPALSAGGGGHRRFLHEAAVPAEVHGPSTATTCAFGPKW